MRPFQNLAFKIKTTHFIILDNYTGNSSRSTYIAGLGVPGEDVGAGHD